MESTHGQLGTRLTDGLCGNYADCFTNANRLTVCKVSTVTFCTDTLLSLTIEDGTDLNLCDTCINDLLSGFLVDHLFAGSQNFAGLRMNNIICKVTSGQTFCQAFNNTSAVFDIVNHDTFVSTTVIATDDNILRYVNQTTSQVTRVRSTQRGICQTFTSASRGLEVLQDV